VREIRRHPARIDVVATARVDRHDFGVTAFRAIIQRHVDVELTISLVAED
jgi:polyisoprenoid-binding protein YceI